ncbi:MAG: hypothetical protein OCD01_15365 [Fibrobacterales bacterium]
MELALEHRETSRYYIFLWGLLVLINLSSFAFGLFVYRGVLYGEFSLFKALLLLFIPYGLYSIVGTFRRMAYRFTFSKESIGVEFPFRKKSFIPISEVEGIDVSFFKTKIEVVLLSPTGATLAVLTKSRRFSQDVGIVRKLAKLSGIRSVK